METKPKKCKIHSTLDQGFRDMCFDCGEEQKGVMLLTLVDSEDKYFCIDCGSEHGPIEDHR